MAWASGVSFMGAGVLALTVPALIHSIGQTALLGQGNMFHLHQKRTSCKMRSQSSSKNMKILAARKSMNIVAVIRAGAADKRS